MLRVTKMLELQAILAGKAMSVKSFMGLYNHTQELLGFSLADTPSGQSLALEPLFRCCIVDNEEQGNPKRKQK